MKELGGTPMHIGGVTGKVGEWNSCSEGVCAMLLGRVLPLVLAGLWYAGADDAGEEGRDAGMGM